jgi:putative endonuclease
MAGLVPAIHVLEDPVCMAAMSTFLRAHRMASSTSGVTNDLVRRIHEHRNGLVPGFTKRYSVKRLVYFERYDDIQTAIQREHNMKHWSRTWKVRLILKGNPEWNDLYDSIAV